MKKIAIEEHFFTQEHLDNLRSRKGYPRLQVVEDLNHKKIERYFRSSSSSRAFPTQHLGKLLDLGGGRLDEMDKAGIDMQVLSMPPPSVDEVDVATGAGLAASANDQLADAVKAHPDRLAGFATLAYADPAGAAKELERCVTRLGFKGASVNSHAGGEYLDDKKYWALFEAAQSLNVPVYLHPKDPPPALLGLLEPYTVLTAAMWGFGAETGLHAMRLICSGVFDAFPRLRIILGHLGEGIPFWLWRIDNRWEKSDRSTPKRRPSEYLKENIYVTTSGMFDDDALLHVYRKLGADRILFAVDYPYETCEEGASFVENLPIPEADRRKICHMNAQKLLALA